MRGLPLTALVGQEQSKVNDDITEKLILAKVSEAGKIKNHMDYDFHVKKYVTGCRRGEEALLGGGFLAPARHFYYFVRKWPLMAGAE